MCLAICWAAMDGMGTDAHSLTVSPEALAKTQFPIPSDQGARSYLGLSGKGSFTLPQVDADILVVEVFSMYCPYCQAEAHKVNELYNLIAKHSGSRGRIKILGIGIGNTPYEVDTFRRKFKVPFPLVADEDMAIKAWADKSFRTPTFIVLKKGRGSNLRIMNVHVGQLENVRRFFQKISRM
jgi:thiol-disulfide isomerase/thioredoxin